MANPGYKLRAWRAAKHISLATLAKELDVNVSTLSRLERGLSTPKTALALKIAKASRGALPITAWAEDAA